MTFTGTISRLRPGTFVVKTTISSDRISYSYTTTIYGDEDGKPVSSETRKAGLPVTAYYDRNGNKTVATKVVVTRAVPADPYHPKPR